MGATKLVWRHQGVGQRVTFREILGGLLRLRVASLGFLCVGKLFRYKESTGGLLVGNEAVDRIVRTGIAIFWMYCCFVMATGVFQVQWRSMSCC